MVLASKSGYLQFVGYSQLTQIAELLDAVIRLDYRPGHFIVAGRPLARVLPSGAAKQVEQAIAKAHVTGPHRTLMQDPVFALDQLVEIAIRALSPAVNDTFTALTCLDWISSGLNRISGRDFSERVYRDDAGRVRLIGADWSYPKMVDRAYDKIRQAASGMPAVIIRMLDSLVAVVGRHDDAGAARGAAKPGRHDGRRRPAQRHRPPRPRRHRARYARLVRMLEGRDGDAAR